MYVRNISKRSLNVLSAVNILLTAINGKIFLPVYVSSTFSKLAIISCRSAMLTRDPSQSRSMRQWLATANQIRERKSYVLDNLLFAVCCFTGTPNQSKIYCIIRIKIFKKLLRLCNLRLRAFVVGQK